jgi:hypothetical protein
MHYPMAVILPPKIYHYEPKICGFNIVGKRGSKFFEPPRGNVRYIEDSVQSLEMQDIRAQQEVGNSSSASQMAIDFSKKLTVESSAAKGAAASSTGEDGEA